MSCSSPVHQGSGAFCLGPSKRLGTDTDNKVSIELNSDHDSDGENEPIDSDGIPPQGRVSTIYILLLTCSFFGLQVVWSLLLTAGTPYLLSLGLSRSLTALVWVAGPLCGTFVHPVVGLHSDRSTHRWGRRKPYIVGGAVSTMICILALAYTKDLVELVVQPARPRDHSNSIDTTVMVLAVFWVYALNVAIQPLQSGIRALAIDQCPAHQQVAMSAWASRFGSLGSTFTCALGFTYLPSWLPFGDTQFKSLSVIASISLLPVLMSSLMIREDRPRLEKIVCPRPTSNATNFRSQLFPSWKAMPPQARSICKIQFVSWIGWFPFLFYTTTYIGDLYVKEIMAPPAVWPPSATETMEAHASRVGNLATLLSAIVTLMFNIALPLLLKPCRLSSRMALFGLPLPHLWMLSQILFATCMSITFFVHTYSNGVILVAVVGASWALATWIPFALISVEIAESKLQSGVRQQLISKEYDGDGSGDQAAAIMGIHNMAIAAPQIIAALACSCLLHLFQVFRVEDGLGWVLHAAGMAALGAAVMTSNLQE